MRWMKNSWKFYIVEEGLKQRDREKATAWTQSITTNHITVVYDGSRTQSPGTKTRLTEGHATSHGEGIPLLKWLCTELGIEEAVIKAGIEKVHRRGAGRARYDHVPREITIKFEKKNLRNQVLTMPEEKERVVDGRQLNIFREVPWGARLRRQPYKAFAHN